MKERPILFSAPMVRAILEGQKTQTRRIVKPRKDHFCGCLLHPHELAGEINAGRYLNSIYGQPGDQLWVREAWMQEAHPADLGITEKDIPLTWKQACAAAGSIYYRADQMAELYADGRKWKPSIHMPRAFSRIQLEITAIRIERLQDASEADCIAEGAPWAACGFPQEGSHKAGFAQLWEKINGDGSWDANPWVWVVEFKVLKGGAA